MIPALPQPDPIALPAPIGLLWALLILTFTQMSWLRVSGSVCSRSI